MYQLPFTVPVFDFAIIHQVLHYAEQPQAVIAEAARVIRPGGRLLIVDFAPHTLEVLREEQAHRRLGFADHEIADWAAKAGFAVAPQIHLPGDPLTVTIWSALREADIEFVAEAPAARPSAPSNPGAQTAASFIGGYLS
jgi:ArsR family transcriptional regulator